MLVSKDTPVYCVGWTGSPVEVYDQLWQPTPPKSYKSPEARQGWVDDLKADTPVLPYVGEAADMHVLDAEGTAVFSTPDPKRFLQWADAQAKFTAMNFRDHDADTVQAVFIGFNVKQLFLSVAAQLWAAGVEVPFRFWHGTPGLFDISDLLVPGTMRNGFDAGSLLAFGANRYLPAAYKHFIGPGQALMTTAEEKAIVTRALAQFAQLI